MPELTRKRILIVEDVERQAAILQQLLEWAGYEARAERAAASALRCAPTYHPDLIILDLTLPDLDGYELCRRLRQALAPWVPPVIMLTGRDRPIDQLRGFAFGAEAYLTKPYDVEDVLKTIELLLGQGVAGHGREAADHG